VAVTNSIPEEERVRKATKASLAANQKFTKLSTKEKSEWGRRASLAAAAKRRKSHKAIILVAKDGIKFYHSSVKEACDVHGLSLSCLLAVLRGGRKRHKGFTAQYADEGR
jgi:hypothetical protein